MTKKDQAIKKADELIKKMKDPVHDKRHVERVLAFAAEIVCGIDIDPAFDPAVLELAVWWHDVGRLERRADHSSRSAELMEKELNLLGYSEELIAKVSGAITTHGTTGKPVSTEGKVLRDADKLDLLSVERWKNGIKSKRKESIEEAIRRISEMKAKTLFFERSKRLFDLLFPQLLEYVEKNTDDDFKTHKEKLLKLKEQI